jgi:ParE toxin of type II toxin-antitoxin system, parDE
MPARTLYLAPRVLEQMAEVLERTLTRFGDHKAAEYRQLIANALVLLESDAESDRQRPDIAHAAWSLHLGRGTRHLFLYRIEVDRVLVNDFACDAMNLPARWRDDE